MVGIIEVARGWLAEHIADGAFSTSRAISCDYHQGYSVKKQSDVAWEPWNSWKVVWA